jgi:hypothetical protein
MALDDLITFRDRDGNVVKEPWPENAASTSSRERLRRVFTLADFISGHRCVSDDTALVVAALLYALERVGDEAVEERSA